MTSSKLSDMGPRELAAAAIMAAGEEAIQVWNDPKWAQRRRLGDPTVTSELVERACAQVGMDAAQTRSVTTLLAGDAQLKQLLASTIATSTAAAGAAATSSGRQRFWLGFMLVMGLIGVLCGALWLVLGHYQPMAEKSGHPNAGGGTSSP